MGELSKKIGEHGEHVIRNFLTCIGWHNPSDGETISCCSPDDHQRKTDTPRKTHGLDLFFSYKSNLEDFTLDNVLISVKYTGKPYPLPPNSQFKAHFKDIAQTIQCFSKSSLRHENNKSFEYSGMRKSNDTGVLFWITSCRDSDQEVISKVAGVVLDKTLEFGSIQVVDSARASFIYNSVNFAKNIDENSEMFFHYAFSSSNYTDPDIEKYGKILPVEYLTSPLLPMRIVNKDTNTQIFCIACNESYNDQAMKRLLNFASDVCQDFSSEFIFLFSQYDEIQNKTSVNSSLRILGEKASGINVKVYSYNDDFRGLINEQ